MYRSVAGVVCVVWVNITLARNPKLEPDALRDVYDWWTALMYQQNCWTACSELQITSCTPACRVGWAAVAMLRISFAILLQRLPVKLRLTGFS